MGLSLVLELKKYVHIQFKKLNSIFQQKIHFILKFILFWQK